VEVADTGKGIPPVKLEKIFDRFYRLDDSETRDAEGSGLGLALTKELVDLYRGEINVESKEGSGSTFTVRIPISRDLFTEEEIITSSEYHCSSREQIEILEEQESLICIESDDMDELDDSDSRPVILIVEDNVDLLNYIARNLEEGYSLMTASNGKKALIMATKCIPNLVISDIMMPVMDGMELSKELKIDEKTNHIPVILLTARADRESKLEGLQIGVDDYLIKPFDPEELQFRVKNLLEQRERLKEKFRKEFSVDGDIRLPSPEDSFTEKVYEILESHLEEPEYTIDQLARDLNLSRAQVYRKVSGVTGFSPNELLRSLRLKKAALLFRSGHSNVTQVMYQVGFNNASYFAKCFKDVFGINPSEYITQKVK
jgi:DNA-binding response OmpR family regulator